MNTKTNQHYWVDMVMLLLAFALAVSSFVLWVILPQGFFAARLVWIQIHKWVGLALGVAATVHVSLHWRWLIRITRLHWKRLFQRQVEKG